VSEEVRQMLDELKDTNFENNLLILDNLFEKIG